MVVLDAHSIPTMDKHYLLREPEDDVALAKLLVREVLGTTATFPAHCPRVHSWKKLVGAFDQAKAESQVLNWRFAMTSPNSDFKHGYQNLTSQ